MKAFCILLQASVVPLIEPFAFPSAVRNFLRALVIYESNTSKSGVIRPNMGLDDLISSTLKILFHGSMQLSLLEIKWSTVHFLKHLFQTRTNLSSGKSGTQVVRLGSSWDFTVLTTLHRVSPGS